MARPTNANNPNYPYLAYCGECLGPIRHEAKRGESTRRVCVNCGQDENFITQFLVQRKVDESREILSTLPPEFQAFYAYTEKGQTSAQLLPGQAPEKENS